MVRSKCANRPRKADILGLGRRRVLGVARVTGYRNGELRAPTCHCLKVAVRLTKMTFPICDGAPSNAEPA